MCGESRMHGVKRGKTRRLYQRVTYRYNMQRKHTKRCTIQETRCITMTQEKSTQTSCLISTLYAEDSLAKAFQSLENEKDSAIPEELSSLRSPGLPPLKNLSICSLKMFPDCYHITKAGRLRPSSVRWMNWGTMSYGKCLTAQILVYPNPEKECIFDFVNKT